MPRKPPEEGGKMSPTSPDSSQYRMRGKGNPNIYLQRDYSGTNGWEVRVETVVPVADADVERVRETLGSGDTKMLDDLASKLVGDVPKTHLARFHAQHMVAAAFGKELTDDGKVVPRKP